MWGQNLLTLFFFKMKQLDKKITELQKINSLVMELIVQLENYKTLVEDIKRLIRNSGRSNMVAIDEIKTLIGGLE